MNGTARRGDAADDRHAARREGGAALDGDGELVDGAAAAAEAAPQLLWVASAAQLAYVIVEKTERIIGASPAGTPSFVRQLHDDAQYYLERRHELTAEQ